MKSICLIFIGLLFVSCMKNPEIDLLEKENKLLHDKYQFLENKYTKLSIEVDSIVIEQKKLKRYLESNKVK